MSNETLEELIRAFNERAFSSYFALRRLTDTVTLGHVWLQPPTGRGPESSRRVYFVLSGERCVGIVLDMGFHPPHNEDLHWYVLKEYRGRGHLHRALRNHILPHLFSDGRESQRVTTNSPENAKYVARQGFVPTGESDAVTGETIFTMSRDQVDFSRAPQGQDLPLTVDEVEDLKARLRQAKAMIVSVDEKLHSHGSCLALDGIARDIEEVASCMM